MNSYFAQPYDCEAAGFYFKNEKQFKRGLKKAVNAYGQRVEEFEILFLGDDPLDGALFEALAVHQGNVLAFIVATENWSDDQKIALVLAVGESGYAFELGRDEPDQIEIDVYPHTNMRELAEQFIDDGLFGEIPQRISFYIDYDAVARDLACDYTQTQVAGVSYVYRCA